MKSTTLASYGKGIRKLLVLYDLIVFLIALCLIFVFHPSRTEAISNHAILSHLVIGFICIFGSRMLGDVYRQIWRYGNIHAYIRLILSDIMGGFLYILIARLLISEGTFIHELSMVSIDLLGVIIIRAVYYVVYHESVKNNKTGNVLRKILEIAGGVKVKPDAVSTRGGKTKIAIVGAGRVGVALAEELLSNPRSGYEPVCFIDDNEGKIGRQVNTLFVLAESEATPEYLNSLGIHEVVFAIPNESPERKKELYDYYTNGGCRVKSYDYPTMQSTDSGKRKLREFEIEELLFRTPQNIIDDKTYAYYRNKIVMVTGGGGSIGSELCRQLVKMNPRKIIILDICENGAYDLQQEILMNSEGYTDLKVEILSICDRLGLEKIFEKHRPDIVIHAAAHKHVPLMENNCCEAIKNNVFGTLNVVDMSEKYGVQRFMMVSTDKAVNPTSVMGATKRVCEMIVQSKSAERKEDETTYSLTRFGNVLGSAGSVIPLFKKQIANGGPVTITDKRIIRYFMTIPEASQLVLKSGAMAKNGELFVLDMGKPMKILELAENMIRLSGLEPYKDIEIRETGLRPGEKLYEELLVKGEHLSSTEDSKIFIEKDLALTGDKLMEKLDTLRQAAEAGNEKSAREALTQVVPTYTVSVMSESENSNRKSWLRENT